MFSEFYTEVDLGTRVKEARFVVFDCEASELKPSRASLLSVGALRVKTLELDLSDAFYELVLSDRLGAVEVHGITREDLERFGRPPKAVIENFLKYIKGSILVGFYAGFDSALVDRYSREFFGYPLLNFKLDVFELYRRRHGRGESLEGIARELGLEVRGRHVAIDDAYITALVFLKLIYPYRDEKLKNLPLFL